MSGPNPAVLREEKAEETSAAIRARVLRSMSAVVRVLLTEGKLEFSASGIEMGRHAIQSGSIKIYLPKERFNEDGSLIEDNQILVKFVSEMKDKDSPYLKTFGARAWLLYPPSRLLPPAAGKDIPEDVPIFSFDPPRDRGIKEQPVEKSDNDNPFVRAKNIADKLFYIYVRELEVTKEDLQRIIKEFFPQLEALEQLDSQFIDTLHKTRVDSGRYELLSLFPDENFIKTAVEELKKNRNEQYQQPQKIAIISHLEKYINKVKGFKDASNPTKINFSKGFWFFKNSRALNREANYLLAEDLLKRLQGSDLVLNSVFATVKKRREALIIEQGLNTKKDFKDRGIRSKDLNAIIKMAK